MHGLECHMVRTLTNFLYNRLSFDHFLERLTLLPLTNNSIAKLSHSHVKLEQSSINYIDLPLKPQQALEVACSCLLQLSAIFLHCIYGDSLTTPMYYIPTTPRCYGNQLTTPILDTCRVITSNQSRLRRNGSLH